MTEYVTIESAIYGTLLQKVKDHETPLDRVNDLEKKAEELQKRLWIYENPNVPSSKKMTKEKDEEERKQEGRKGAPVGHLGTTRERPRPNRFIDLKPNRCTGCNSPNKEIIGGSRGP